MTKKKINLEEARNEKQIDRFAKEHPSEGDKDKLEAVIGAMAKGKPRAKDEKA